MAKLDEPITADQIIREQLRQINDRLAGCDKRIARLDDQKAKELIERAALEDSLARLTAGVGIDVAQFQAEEEALKAAVIAPIDEAAGVPLDAAAVPQKDR